jgi:hypothetical protein
MAPTHRVLGGRHRWALLVGLAFVPSVAAAFFFPCTFTGNTIFAPFHPRPADAVQFGVSYGQPEVDSFDPSAVSLTRATQSSAKAISLDVLVTTTPSRHPDYAAARVIGTIDSTVIEVGGTLGTLSVGDYSITTTVSVETASTPAKALCSKTSTLQVYATTGIEPVVEYYHAGLDHYFMTQDPSEIRDLDTGVHPGWVRTGESMLAYAPGQTNGYLNAVVRYARAPGASTHFYTLAATPEDAGLRAGALGDQWAVETFDAFEVYSGIDALTSRCQLGTMPVYRLWNARADSNHRYTTSLAIRQAMIARGYVSEGYGADGVVMCALAP